MASTLADPVLGRLIDGRYLVRARIARGGMATVYLAHDRRLDREVAIKIMHPHVAEGTDVVARFRREARASARLTHPGIVGVYDQGADGDMSYLTMEYVNGHNLRRELRLRGAFTLEGALRATALILDALGAAHRAGLVHRDIKPENVLVSTDGTLKVADFGLARAVTEATAATTGNLLGTVAYLSPEIITSGTADARADIYAVGIMLYELLTSHAPYQGETPIQVAYQHVNNDVPRITDILDWVPSAVADLIARMCARNPHDRPIDAVAAYEQVRVLLESLPEQVRELRADIDGDSATESGPADETISVISPSTTALPIGAVTNETQRLPDRFSPARRKRRRRRILGLILTFLAVLGVGSGAWWYFSHGPGAFTQVPDVTGESVGTATSVLSQSRLFTSETDLMEFSDEVPLGQVIRTEPASGESIRYEDAVTLVVSDGIRMITMPELEGMNEAEIRTVLTDAGWDGEDLAVATDWSLTIDEGIFISSKPEAGVTITHASTISVVLSDGPAPVTVRSVLSLSEDNARSDLEEQGLNVAIAESGQFSDSVPEGHVISQSPAGSGQAHEGDTVTLTLSKGPELFEVPSLFGKQYEEAAEILEDAGFVPKRENWMGGVFGTVRSETPASGTLHPKGTVITLLVF